MSNNEWNFFCKIDEICTEWKTFCRKGRKEEIKHQQKEHIAMSEIKPTKKKKEKKIHSGMLCG